MSTREPPPPTGWEETTILAAGLAPENDSQLVRALLASGARDDQDNSDLPTHYSDDYLNVDVPLRKVSVNGQEIRLTPTEFKLLALFVQHPGEVMTFQKLLEQVWGFEYTREHHYPRIYVSHLRRKIEPDLKNPTYIQSEYGVGYRFVKKADGSA
ncbi:MAG: winged helix-turn-helix transcriptional regulator [Blastochloris sp.]|nr:winged helix-turn-helix transcriptional regulator [Blastochloris sp.]